MRDDIHKSAPVSRAWQSFMKHCNRQADRKERAAQKAYTAISNDCYNELSPKFLSDISQKSAQRMLFGTATSEIHSSHDTTNKAHVLEKEVIAHLERREAFGEDATTAIEGAVSDAIKSRLNSNLVAIKGHWKKHGGHGAKGPIEAAKKIIAALPVNKLAKEILSEGSNFKPKRPRRQGVDLDEDLR